MSSIARKNINGVRSIRPNYMGSHYALATDRGVKIFMSDSLNLAMNLTSVGECRTAEMLGSSNIVGLVGCSTDRSTFDEDSVVLMDVERKEIAHIIQLQATVLQIRFTNDKLVVVLPSNIYVYELITCKLIHMVKADGNDYGLCEVSVNGLMVFPAPHAGHVHVLDLGTLKRGSTTSPLVIKAHQHTISCLAISQFGKHLATASQRGTLIRIFSTETGKKVLELRRGCDTARIYCLTFSPSEELLACSSDKGTVHVFEIADKTQFGRSMIGTWIPAFDGQRSEAQVAVEGEYPSVLLFPSAHTLVVLSMDGTYTKYAVQGSKLTLRDTAYTLDIGEDFNGLC